ncbi:acetyl/propionyl-CoA carboxylase alpha subunit [Arthrobacter ginsengisoli]|uniref:Acetyl/propionyl-CoA carboxylase alpha subunit n=1 Tax=Arthrobacter ginsengisoli TaxID=1356565 RepID=A0ABU1UDG5_9MICC|nr:acetyl/propionyl-CoA carboxylase alpha subunit [Arthrobacter ginsengisoli]
MFSKILIAIRGGIAVQVADTSVDLDEGPSSENVNPCHS